MSHLARGPMRSMGIDSKANGAGRRHATQYIRKRVVGGGAKRGADMQLVESCHAH